MNYPLKAQQLVFVLDRLPAQFHGVLPFCLQQHLQLAVLFGHEVSGADDIPNHKHKTLSFLSGSVKCARLLVFIYSRTQIYFHG